MSDPAPPLASDDVPDWTRPIARADAWLVPAYRTADLFFSVPRAVDLARRADGTPDFFLEVFSDRNAAGDDQALFANLRMGLERRDAGADRDRFVAARGGQTRVVPARLSADAAWHFECGTCRETAPVAWDGAGRATLQTRLPATTGDLIYGQLGTGVVTTARVAVECRVGGVLPRVETTALFEVEALLARLATLHPGAPSLAFDALVTWLKAPPPDLFRLEGEAGVDAGERALALAGRLYRDFGRPAPCPSVSEGPHITLRIPDGTAGPVRWDLRTPYPAELPRFLAFDPFTPIVAAGGRDRVTAFTRVGPLPEDRLSLVVAVSGGFPADLRNCDAIEVVLCVDGALARGHATLARSVTLYPAGRGTQSVTLPFRVSEPKTYRACLQLVVDGTEVLLPWFDGPGSYLHLGPDDVPFLLVSLRATPRLLAQARIAVALVGTPFATALTPQAPSASYLLAPGSVPRIRVTATEPGMPGGGLVLDLPGPIVDLDCDAFPQYGAQSIRAHLTFAPGVASARFAFLPEDALEPILVEVTPERPDITVWYFADRIFHHRYRVRRVRHADDDGPWSEYHSPGESLFLTAAPTSDPRDS